MNQNKWSWSTEPKDQKEKIFKMIEGFIGKDLNNFSGMFDKFGNVFEQFGKEFTKNFGENSFVLGQFVFMNVIETADSFKLTLAAPGLKKEDFKIKLIDDHLVISADRPVEALQEQEKYKKKEYNFNKFERKFQMPENANPDKINASYQDGVLTITIEKTVTEPEVYREIVIE